MEEIYRRTLTPTEAERYYIYIGSDYLYAFPVTQGTVRIKFDKREFKAKINETRGRGRLFLGKFRDYIDLRERCTVVFYKNPDGSFSLSVEK